MHDGPHSTYIVASRSLTLYIGMTGDLRKRVFEHKRKLRDGFSAKYNCNRLVWYETYVDPSNAIAREKQLKGWTRAKKIALITRTNPTWIDLAEAWFTEMDLTWEPNPGGDGCSGELDNDRSETEVSRSCATGREGMSTP